MNSWNAYLFLVCMIVVTVGCSRQPRETESDLHKSDVLKTAYQNGKAEAQRDIADGKLVLKTWGMPVPWIDVYRSNLLSRHQIVMHPVAGCSVTEALIESVKGYNEVSKTEIEKRIGTGVLERVLEESKLLWLQRQTNK
ncbi:MAG: hypothetical protein M9920_17005 [Verrucomicrobiae bacterium]|nr:hypothetical protein [Verrucomicrobiae bacterium]